jgi:hypothetical protein
MEMLTDRIGNIFFIEECDGYYLLHHQNKRCNNSGKFHTHKQGREKRFPSMKSIYNYIRKHEKKLIIR